MPDLRRRAKHETRAKTVRATHENARYNVMKHQTHIQSPLIRETRYEAARREDERQRRIFLLIALPGAIAAVAFLIYTVTR